MHRNPGDAAPEGDKPERRNESDGAQAAGRVQALNDALVAAYLRRHPDFLVRNPELIEALVPPDRRQAEESGPADEVVVDLQRFMLERLRTEIGELRGARDDLLATGRSNMVAQGRVQHAILALMEARSFERLIETITTDLALILNVDAAVLCVERSEDSVAAQAVAGVQRLEPGTVDALIGPGREVCLRPSITGDPALFGALSGLVRSDALLRLRISSKTPPALLAFGSRDPEAFHSNQGTELMSFLAQALALCIRGWLELAE